MPTNTLTAGERQILTEAPSGGLVDLSDLTEEERVVSPDVIRRLCVGSEAKDVDPRGARIKCARIIERLDLSFCTVPHPLRLEETTFAATADLSGAHLPALSFVGCTLPGLQAIRIQLEHDFLLSGTEVSGALHLRDAKIGGSLLCPGATLSNQGVALIADGADVTGTVFLGDGFRATGGLRFLGARIGGQFSCPGATFSNEGGAALTADSAEILGGVFLREGFSATGEVRFPGARIGGQLDCAGATLNNEGGGALFARGAEIKGDVFLWHGFSATGAVELSGTKIGGQLECPGATLSNEGGEALSADRAEIAGDVLFYGGFSATGGLRLAGVKIRGVLACPGAALSNKGGDAVYAYGAEVAGGVFLSDGFRATGGVRLSWARIGGALSCVGAMLNNEGGVALSIDRAEIAGAVFLRKGFSATGAVVLAGMKIDGPLACEDAKIVNPDEIALDARSATITDALTLRNVHVTGGIDLFRARATTLDDDVRTDDPLGSWRGVEPLVLEGFAYERFDNEAESDSKLRREWLESTDGFQQGAWQQLIEVYRRQGRDDEATRAAIAMHNDRMARAGLPWYRKAGRYVLRAVVGHGYRPWLALIWGAAIVAAFALIVWQWSGMFVPGSASVTGSPQPIAYAADTFLPIINLGQADDWTPTDWVRWVTWSVILLGWALSTIFVTGFTRIVRS